MYICVSIAWPTQNADFFTIFFLCTLNLNNKKIYTTYFKGLRKKCKAKQLNVQKINCGKWKIIE
jgi:hypothetical protein